MSNNEQTESGYHPNIIHEKKVLCKLVIFELPVPNSEDEYYRRYPHAAGRAHDFAIAYYLEAKFKGDLPNMRKYAKRILYLEDILGVRRTEFPSESNTDPLTTI